jgi:hypothetical protein
VSVNKRLSGKSPDIKVIFGFLSGAIVGVALGLAILFLPGMIGPRTAVPLPWSPPATPTASLTPVPTLTVTPSPIPTETATPTITPTALQPEGEAFSIGQSVEGRDLLVVRFGSGPIVRMIIGGIHGGYEANTVVLSQMLIDDLRSGAISVPPDITLYILPNLNPDGYYDHLNSSYGRRNANKVDLNRNWDSNWQADWPRAGCFGGVELTAGTGPFSEPETQALAKFILDNHVDALISYHSAAGTIYATGDDTLDPASDDLAKKISAVSYYLYPPPETGCVYTGQLVDWATDHGTAALTIELTTHQSTDIDINRKVLETFLAWHRP